MPPTSVLRSVCISAKIVDLELGDDWEELFDTGLLVLPPPADDGEGDDGVEGGVPPAFSTPVPGVGASALVPESKWRLLQSPAAPSASI